MSKAENIPFDEQSISIRDAVLTLGIKRVIDEIGLKAVIDEIGFERVVEELLKSDPETLDKIEKSSKEKKKLS